MPIWTSIDFSGHWPVPVAAVVVADDEDEAGRLLDAELRQHGLKGFDGSLVRVDVERSAAVVLSDGEY